MTTDQIVTIIVAVIQSGAIGVFVFLLIQGLKTKIKSLNDTIETQKKTLETMDKRISETEKVGEIYQNLVTDLPNAIDNYKKIIEKTMGETIKILEKEKNEKSQETIKQKIQELEKTEKILGEIPKIYQLLESKLISLQTSSYDAFYGVAPKSVAELLAYQMTTQKIISNLLCPKKQLAKETKHSE